MVKNTLLFAVMNFVFTFTAGMIFISKLNRPEGRCVESVQDGMEKSYVEIHKLLRIIGGKETRFLKNYLLCWQISDAEEAE